MTNKEEKPQDNLEQKISKAELKAQKEEGAEDNGLSFDALSDGGTEDTSQEKKGLSRARKIWRRTLIWLVVVAIAFAAGFFLDSTLRYQPEQEMTALLRANLDATRAEIDSLKEEIVSLGKFEEENKTLTKKMDDLNIHLVILGLRAGVADASLAVEQGRQADAKLALSKVGSSLDSLYELLDEDQGEVVDSMIQRYQLVMIELENDGATVLTDLELISSKLLTLENTLFATP
jgi:flagellin-specific chaperone FliS